MDPTGEGITDEYNEASIDMYILDSRDEIYVSCLADGYPFDADRATSLGVLDNGTEVLQYDLSQDDPNSSAYIYSWILEKNIVITVDSNVNYTAEEFINIVSKIAIKIRREKTFTHEDSFINSITFGEELMLTHAELFSNGATTLIYNLQFKDIEEVQQLILTVELQYEDQFDVLTTTANGITILHQVVEDNQHIYLWRVPNIEQENIEYMYMSIITAEHSIDELNVIADNITVSVNENFGNG